MRDEFQGKVACITGASRGIGRAVAQALAARKASLLLIARSERLIESAAELGAQTDILPRRCDVAQFAQVQDAVAAAVARWGRIDIAVNAAAVLGPTGEVWTSDPALWLDAVQANLVGTYNVMRAVLPRMIEARTGKVVNFAGGGAAYGYPRFSAYASSKAAVVRLTETVALECAPYGIQINAIAPGAIETDLLRSVRAAGGEVRTAGAMEQAVDLITFLASSCSDHVTGRFIHARDAYRDWTAGMPLDNYTLRRVES